MRLLQCPRAALRGPLIRCRLTAGVREEKVFQGNTVGYYWLVIIVVRLWYRVENV